MTRPSSAVSSLQMVLVALLAGIAGSRLGEGLEGGTRSPQRVGAAGIHGVSGRSVSGGKVKQDPGLDLRGEPLRGYRLLEKIDDGPCAPGTN